MRAFPVPRFFVSVAALVVAPRTALRRVTSGRWAGLRDALLLLAVGGAVAYTPDLAQAVLIGWDLGIREGVFELARLAQLRVGPDLIVLLIAGVIVVVPARLTRRLSFDRSLALAAVCWMPLFLARLAGHGLRLALGHPPARPLYVPAHILESPEWIGGLLWSVFVTILALMALFGPKRDD
jgi:uncharacterized protein (DUF983 family)